MARKQARKGRTTLAQLEQRIAALERDTHLLSLAEQLKQALRRIAALEAR